MIIDDDDAMRSLLKEIFEQMNIASEAFRNYDNLKNHDFDFDFDFVLTDIQMPKTDGFTVLKKLKEGEINSYKNQPVIAMTGSREHSRDYYFEQGFAEMLPKPFTKQELVAALGRIFPEKMHSLNHDATQILEEEPSVENDIFDLSLLKSFLDTQKALDEILNLFNSQTETDLQEIKKALSQNNIEIVNEIAHRMLTMFRQIKANGVIPILEKMENYSSEIETEIEIQKDFEKLVINIRDLQKALANR